MIASDDWAVRTEQQVLDEVLKLAPTRGWGEATLLAAVEVIVVIYVNKRILANRSNLNLPPSRRNLATFLIASLTSISAFARVVSAALSSIVISHVCK